MNIVFCRYKNMCEPDYIDAFKALGINVVEVFVKEFESESIEKKGEIMTGIILENKPMFIFSINFFPYISIICQAARIKYVSVSVTCPMVEIYNVTIRNKCNRVFLFDKMQYLSVKDENPDCIFYLPLGGAVERVDKLLGDEDKYLYDVSFVGSLYSEKDPFLKLKISDEKKHYFENIINKQIDKSSYGQDFLEECVKDDDVEDIKSTAEDFYSSQLSVSNIDRFVAINNYLSPHMTFIERVKLLNYIAEKTGENRLHFFTQSDVSDLHGMVCHGGVNTLNEMPFVFRQSKINLNFSTRSIKTGIPQRVWDVLSCRGFLLTNYQEEIPEYFTIGEHLAAYENKDELIELIKYYLVHDDEREQIAYTGYIEVRQRGTVLNRVIEIIKKIA